MCYMKTNILLSTKVRSFFGFDTGRLWTLAKHQYAHQYNLTDTTSDRRYFFDL
jgi:hypothetical protein